MTPEQYIINACVANDPSIMELKFGTKVKNLTDDNGEIEYPREARLVRNIVYTTWVDEFGKEYEPLEPWCKILGRDIYLHDVLGAIGIVKGNEKRDFMCTVFGGTDKILIGTNHIEWNLKKTLHEQEEETKLLLAQILGFKE